MIFRETGVQGCFRIEPELFEDERGTFARTFCADSFHHSGLHLPVIQCSASFNRHQGTLRGLHYQDAPHREAKLVRCTRGRIFDVAVDLRPESPTYRAWTGHELTEENYHALYVPEGCAHGFLTLCADSAVFYQISSAYRPELARGIRWDDPAIGIAWPKHPLVMSERDRELPTLENSR